MAITVVNGVPRFQDDSSSAQVTQVYHNTAGVWALVGPSSYLLAGSAATLSTLKQANPTFRVVTLQAFLLELLGTTDLTSDRLANATPGNQGR
jgi:hypothetical protein